MANKGKNRFLTVNLPNGTIDFSPSFSSFFFSSSSTIAAAAVAANSRDCGKEGMDGGETLIGLLLSSKV